MEEKVRLVKIGAEQHQKLKELAKADRRSMRHFLDVIIDKMYEELKNKKGEKNETMGS